MEIDGYTTCPGGTGKKIKFCGCKDIVADLDKVARLMSGEQRVAANQHLDRLLEKHPGRACLLGMKTAALMQLGELDQASSTVDTFLEHHPDNPLALSQQAMLTASLGDLENAIEPLHRAISMCDQSIPMGVIDSLTMLGQLLVVTGNVLAGRAYIKAAMAITNDRSPEILTTLARSYVAPNLSTLVREDLGMLDRPEDVPWADEFDQALESAQRMQWLNAVEQLDKLAEQQSHPAILKNAAVLRTWIGQNNKTSAALRRYAQADSVSFDEASEAEALAQYLDELDDPDAFDVIRHVLPITDFEQLLVTVASDRRFQNLPFHPQSLSDEDTPPPRAVYQVLDREALEESSEMTVESVPQVIAQVAVYGKETDRDARLELLVEKNHRLDAANDVVKSALGDLLAAATGDDEVIGQIGAIDATLRIRRVFGPGTDAKVAAEIIAADTHDHVLNGWTALPSRILDGKSPAEVADDPGMRLKLAGAVLGLECHFNDANHAELIRQLRDKLNIPQPAPLNPAKVDVREVSLISIRRLEAEKLTDDQLELLYNRHPFRAEIAVLLPIARQIISRQFLDDRVDKSRVYEFLARMTDDEEKSYEFFEKAREVLTARGESPAEVLVHELQFCLERGNGERLQTTLELIQRKYINEPGVGPAVTQLLMQAGLIDPMGRPVGAPPQAAAPVAEQGPASEGLWTPDSPAQPATGQQEGESKLWLPGMD